MSTASAKDWSASQYLKFKDERTRAVKDLILRIPLLPAAGSASSAAAAASTDASPLRIVDLGCGPGNSTAELAERFPGATITGVDSSPNMLERARQSLPGVAFTVADLRTYEPPPPPPTLLFANAVFQWLGHAERLPTILRLLRALPPGGVLAYQVPDNKEEPSHRAMREVAQTKGAPWLPYLATLHDRDPIEPPEEIYDALVPHCARLDIWHSLYQHVLPGGAADIVEWVKGTGLQPFLNALPPDGPVRAAYLAAYQARLAELYLPRRDGSVLLRYPRLFVVAVRK